jgi:hypothetical protein
MATNITKAGISFEFSELTEDERTRLMSLMCDMTIGARIKFSRLTEEEYRRLMDLCCDIGIRRGIDAGHIIEVEGNIIQYRRK